MNNQTNSLVCKKSSYIDFILILLVIAYVFLPFSPFCSFITAIFGMFFSKKRSSFFAFSLPFVISFSLIAVSRELFGVVSDDFETYYDVFLNLDKSFFYFYSEFFINVVNFFIKFSFGVVQPRALMFLYSILSVYILFISIFYFLRNKTAFTDVEIFKVLAIFSLFTPFFAPTIFVRQYFSIAFFILSLSFRQGNIKFLFFILSLFFHHAIFFLIVVYFFCRYLIRKPILFLLFTFFIFGISFFLGDMVKTLLDGLPKIRAWIFLNESFSFLNFISNYYLLVGMIFFSFLTAEKSRFYHLRSYLVFIFMLALAVDMIFPYVSLRFFLILFVLSGAIFGYIALCSKFKVKLLFLFMALGVFKQVNLQLLNDRISYSTIYKAYPPYSTEPFYYFSSILEDIPARKRGFTVE